MALEPKDIRVTTDGYVDVRYPGTDNWVRTCALLRTAGGQDVKIIEEQAIWFREIYLNFNNLKTTLESLRANQDTIAQLPDALKEFDLSLETGTRAAQDSNTKLEEVKDTLSRLITDITGSLDTNTQAIAKLSTVPDSLEQIEQSLAVLSDLKTSIDYLKPATDIYEDVLNLPSAQEVTFVLPDGTKTLTFRGRKYLDSNGAWRSRDIRWSFTKTAVTGQKYQTLFAGSEESQSNIIFTGKSLYLWCDVNISVELICSI